MAVLLLEKMVTEQKDQKSRARWHGDLSERKFNLVLSMLACFIAVEAGALAVSAATAVLAGGPWAIFDGIAIWAFGQPLILLIALFSMPIGAFVRMILGLAFDQPRRVALRAGAIIGL